MDLFGLTENEQRTNLHQYNHALFHNMMFFSDMVWEINVRTGTAVVMEDKANPGRGVTQFDYGELFREYLSGRIPEEDQQVFRDHLALDRLRGMREEMSLEYRVRGQDGGWEVHRAALTPAFEENGELSCVYLCTRNIQQEVQRAREDARIQQQFRDALISDSYLHYSVDISGDGLIHGPCVARDGCPVIQLAVGRELPVPYAEFVQRWNELYHPEFDGTSEEDILTLEYLRRCYDRGDRLLDFEIRQTPPPGGTAGSFMQNLIVLTEDSKDGHIWATIIWRDISKDRRGAVERHLELQDSNERLRHTVGKEEQFRLASLSGAIMVYNINLSKNLIEDEFYEIVDGQHYPMLALVDLTAPCSFDEFCRRWAQRKVPADAREKFLRMFNREYFLDAYARGERQLEIEFDTVIGRGIPITLRSTALMIQDASSGDILAMVHGKDVSVQRAEERSQREALRQAYDAANNANAAKSTFLARMSHDIRTPMNAIIGMTAIARTHLDDPERVADCLEKITVSSKHLLGLINEVLDMSKIESGKVDLQDEEFELPQLIDELMTMCRPQIQAKRHTLTVAIRDIRHERVIGDSQRIQQAFMNLMSNAVKYTPDGGEIALTLSEKPTGKPLVGCYEFVIRDNGIGMSPQFLKQLFDPFTRAEDPRVEKIQGTGLGLSIARNIIQMMNGNIRVESEPDKGTTFTATFFLRLQTEEELVGSDAFQDLPILVADDDEGTCVTACDMLQSMGMKGEWVLTGQEAVEKVARRHQEAEDYFAVILDWKMPGMDGLETARRIRETVGEDVPIIIISAYDWSDIELEARAAGANAFVGKPLFKSRLSHVFKELLLPEASQARKTSIETFAESSYAGRRVLLVEDNDLNAEIAQEILGMVELEVEWVRDGREALDCVARAKPGWFDLIFMDLQMPVMDGLSATRAIRALPGEYPKQVPIVAMSANTFAEDVAAARAAGMDDYVAKPLDFEQLEKTLQKWLGK